MPDILYEDNHVLVAVKPANMLSQADQTGDTDILSLLKEDIRVRYQKPGNAYLGLVHRLDRPVGGLMVFARTSKAAARLSAQLQKHELGREYLCVGGGQSAARLHPDRLPGEGRKPQPCHGLPQITEGAQEAILHGQTVCSRDGLSLCAIRLETGRTHQIRVHMAHAGAPLWGDNRYGNGIPGQQIALYGYKLTFEHPVTHEIMSFMSMPYAGIFTQFQDHLDGIWLEFQAQQHMQGV